MFSVRIKLKSEDFNVTYHLVSQQKYLPQRETTVLPTYPIKNN